MKLKRKMIISRAITLAMGIVLIFLGLNNNNNLLSIGIGLLAVGIIQTYHTISLIINKEKFIEFSNNYYDERNVYIAQKSYAFTFWISVYSEFIAVIVLSYLKQDLLASVFSNLVCVQLLLYVILQKIYNRKY